MKVISVKDLAQERHFRLLLASTKRKPWVVHPKPPFGGPEVALKYLARYTHRVAISDQRTTDLFSRRHGSFFL